MWLSTKNWALILRRPNLKMNLMSGGLHERNQLFKNKFNLNCFSKISNSWFWLTRSTKPIYRFQKFFCQLFKTNPDDLNKLSFSQETKRVLSSLPKKTLWSILQASWLCNDFHNSWSFVKDVPDQQKRSNKPIIMLGIKNF